VDLLYMLCLKAHDKLADPALVFSEILGAASVVAFILPTLKRVASVRRYQRFREKFEVPGRTP
jgi:hypothetical protein